MSTLHNSEQPLFSLQLSHPSEGIPVWAASVCINRFPYFFFRNKRTRYPVSDRPQSFKNYAIIRLVGFAWGNKSCTSFTYPFISVTQLRRRIFTWALRRLMTDPGAALLTNFHHLSTPPWIKIRLVFYDSYFVLLPAKQKLVKMDFWEAPIRFPL